MQCFVAKRRIITNVPASIHASFVVDDDVRHNRLAVGVVLAAANKGGGAVHHL